MRYPILILMLVAVSGIAGCAPSNCAGWRQINPSAQDVVTRATQDQIIAHNRYGEQACGWRPNARGQ